MEGFAALGITLVLLLLLCRGKHAEKLYPLYLVIYGGTRFVLNFLRETRPFVLAVPAGHLWSLVSILIGLLWLYASGKMKKDGSVSKDI